MSVTLGNPTANFHLNAHGRDASDDLVVFRLYHYDPTLIGAVVFVLFFLGTSFFHIWQLYRSRCWFAIPLIVGGLFEVIGYAGRCVSSKESPNWTLGPYIIQAILLLVAPALFAATIYMELGRIMILVRGEDRAVIRRTWLTKAFVGGDILSFFLQGGGGGYQASGTLEALKTGSDIIIAGLFVQLLFFGVFLVVSVLFHRSIVRIPTSHSTNPNVPWKRHLNVLYLTGTLIMIRSIFRAVEYLQGFNGYLLRHEAYLYVFDAALMLFVMIIFNFIHPGEIMMASGYDQPKSDGEIELISQGRHERLPADVPEVFDFKLYRYNPSLPAAVTAVIVFTILTVLHVWRLYKARAKYFIAFTLGGAFQSVGYAGRIWNHYDESSIGGFVMQAILILVAPALYAASIYMILGRLIRTLRASDLSLVPPQWVTRIFVAGDVVAFSLQAGGGGVQAAGTLELYNIGEKIIITGLFVQIAFFGFFVITSILFHNRLNSRPTEIALTGSVPWRRYLYVLYATSMIILVRSIFRVVEYLQGNAGYLISREIFLYVFDTILMAVVMLIFLLWYVQHLEQQKVLEQLELSSS
ncbi:unnamed protein product [Clonostachys chloroleuca]|uniref:Uncharacterized protein n=1 Tax=Clonostachys chloroleuca TaxID=1926264 RepID=A0AA35LT72_9HYPO|nr:unnamed protein product [Clonostachys chloroleuca]